MTQSLVLKHFFFILTHTYTHPVHPIQSHGFQYYPYADNSQIYTFSPGLTSELQTCISNCPPDICTWISKGISNINISNPFLISPSKLLLQSSHSITCQIHPFSGLDQKSWLLSFVQNSLSTHQKTLSTIPSFYSKLNLFSSLTSTPVPSFFTWITTLTPKWSPASTLVTCTSQHRGHSELVMLSQIIQTKSKLSNSLPFHLENKPRALQWPRRPTWFVLPPFSF